MPAPVLPVAALVSILAGIAVTPDPIAFQLGPIPVYWYGVCYAVGLALTYLVITREARRRGLDARLVDNGIIIVAVVALIGGRLYHVIDQWQLYQDDLLKIVLPPYTGLGVYGGILTGTIAALVVTRLWKQSFWKWTDVIAPGLFVMQAVGRLGNFFNQELYGPPTTLPWGIAIDCEHRVAEYPCATFPVDTTHFQPLFAYESLSGLIGALVLVWIASRPRPWLRVGDLAGIMFIWIGLVRFLVEFLRIGNWRIGDIPTAQLFGAAFVFVGVGILAYGRRRGAPQLVPEPGSAEAVALEEAAAAEAGEAGETAAADDEDFDEFDEFDAQRRAPTDRPSRRPPDET